MKMRLLSNKIAESISAMLAPGSAYYQKQYDSGYPDHGYAKSGDYGSRMGPLSTVNTQNFSTMSNKSAQDRVAAITPMLYDAMPFLLNGVTQVPEIESCTIQRIHWDCYNMGLDVYLQIRTIEGEFWGMFKKFNNKSQSKFTCELFNSSIVRTEIYEVQLREQLRGSLYDWFKPVDSVYEVTDTLVCKDSLGSMYYIKPTSVLTVTDVINYWGDNPSIKLNCDNKDCIIAGPEYYNFKLKTRSA